MWGLRDPETMQTQEQMMDSGEVNADKAIDQKQNFNR